MKKQSIYEKYRNKDPRCKYPFIPSPIGYCWGFATWVDYKEGKISKEQAGECAVESYEEFCRWCEFWEGGNKTMKVIFIKDCTECPLMEFNDNSIMFCNSAAFNTPKKIGTLKEYIEVEERTIPEWCPLGDALLEVSENLKEEISNERRKREFWKRYTSW